MSKKRLSPFARAFFDVWKYDEASPVAPPGRLTILAGYKAGTVTDNDLHKIMPPKWRMWLGKA